MNTPRGVATDGKRLFVSDFANNRILIFNIADEPAVKLGPQFDQGKAVLGKVFNDLNGNGAQDQGEKGMEGVKVASDTGIYAITDSDGKYHFPYIETGQHLLKIDPSTLPEGAVLTTDNPYKVVVTKGILTKVSFGVKLPQAEIVSAASQPRNDKLKVSVTQDPALLKPVLSIEAKRETDKILFTLHCNYFLFIDHSELVLYDKDLKPLKTISLPSPLPLTYELPLQDLPQDQTLHYQLKVYDKKQKEDRTSVGTV